MRTTSALCRRPKSWRAIMGWSIRARTLCRCRKRRRAGDNTGADTSIRSPAPALPGLRSYKSMLNSQGFAADDELMAATFSALFQLRKDDRTGKLAHQRQSCEQVDTLDRPVLKFPESERRFSQDPFELTQRHFV